VIHSTAVGFHMDTVPTIRVIYEGKRPGGKKPVLYVDRHGELVALPREVKPAEPPGEARPLPPKSRTPKR
jgi:hypothetical protein